MTCITGCSGMSLMCKKFAVEWVYNEMRIQIMGQVCAEQVDNKTG